MFFYEIEVQMNETKCSEVLLNHITVNNLCRVAVCMKNPI